MDHESPQTLPLYQRSRRVVAGADALGIKLQRTIDNLQPLDDIAHDVAVAQQNEQHDPLARHFEKASKHAQQSLDSLHLALGEIEGLVRGTAKNRYVDPLRRAAIGAEHICARMSEMRDEYSQKNSALVFSIRQNFLSALISQSEKLIADLDTCCELFKAGLSNDADGITEGRPNRRRLYLEQQETLSELVAFRPRILELKRVFSRLRDNPSQKMSSKLIAVVDEVDSIYLGLDALRDRLPHPELLYCDRSRRSSGGPLLPSKSYWIWKERDPSFLAELFG